MLTEVILALSGEESSLLVAYDCRGILWEQLFEGLLQCLSKDQQRIFAGGVGFVCAVEPWSGQRLWLCELKGMAKALTLIAKEGARGPGLSFFSGRLQRRSGTSHQNSIKIHGFSRGCRDFQHK